MDFKAKQFNNLTKRIEIEGPITLYVDNDDVDTQYVAELVPEIVKALNSIPMRIAIELAEKNQEMRFKKQDEEEEERCRKQDEEGK